MRLSAQIALRGVISVCVAAALLGGVTGCVGKPSADPNPSSSSSVVAPSESASPPASPSSTPSPSASTPAGTPAVALSIGCNTLVSRQQMYDFNPNFGLQSPYTPASGSAAAKAVAAKGTACNWINQTSSDTVTIAVAKPGSDAFAALKSSAQAGTAAPGFGDAAWFSTSGGVGRLDVFTGTTWLVASSVYFGTPADASDLVKDALAQL